MASALRLIVILLFFTVSISSFAQVVNTDVLKPDPDKEKKFLPYLAVRHGGLTKIEDWKKSNTYLYYQELWYYSESFYIKRNHLASGAPLNEEIIDISRFEDSRKENEVSIVILSGFKDALVLLPKTKLIYSPAH